MKYSKPASRVELVSIGAGGVTIDDLLTVKIALKVRWLEQGVSIGDAGIHPAEPLLAVFKRLRLPDFFRFFNLESIKEDGLDNLHKIGGDGDGHTFMVGTRSQRFYAMWHGETEFEPVAGTTKAFIQWVIRERSDHLQGCPWEVFTTGSKRTFLETIWHREQVDPAPLLEKAKEILDWDREYVSPFGFELLSEKHEVSLRFKKEHRGHNSHVRIAWARKTPQIESYQRWLKKCGFGRVWH
jgi:hypothetical protein